ncbi:LysR family transcriptional regulator [Burkholderia sp. Ax-1719]|uniref:LysR family transcriptional regulator n=1 Tax=Burkholderia sp. Ax-1719 TaxID=2608334 RepID=UPI0014221DD9|nr:LysR family transcriptional regulator [Burkholderia sp. Ax-1719]NIE63161.1 LysR family transcriptional regulator [Burkholderia sp. Ax-1719]
MTFTQLQIFALVAEVGSFTAASQKLGITQSAVSHAIKQLESEWGLSLLNRGAPFVEVTAAGRHLLLRVRELLGVEEAIKQELSAIKGLNEGALRIGSFGVTSSLVLLPKVLERFSAAYPRIDLVIEEGTDDEVAQWILERRVDIGFLNVPDERFDTTLLAEDQFYALVPASHPIAKQNTVSLADLCTIPFVMSLAGNRNLFEGFFRAAGLTPQVKHRCGQMVTMIQMVEYGACALAAELSVPDQLMELCPGAVKRPLSPAIHRSVGLAVPTNKHVSPAVQAFIETAIETLRPTRKARSRHFP